MLHEPAHAVRHQTAPKEQHSANGCAQHCC